MYSVPSGPSASARSQVTALLNVVAEAVPRLLPPLVRHSINIMSDEHANTDTTAHNTPTYLDGTVIKHSNNDATIKAEIHAFSRKRWRVAMGRVPKGFFMFFFPLDLRSAQHGGHFCYKITFSDF